MATRERWARARSSCPQCSVPERTLACRLSHLPSQTTPGGHCRARAQPLRVTQERKPLAECTQSRPCPKPTGPSLAVHGAKRACCPPQEPGHLQGRVCQGKAAPVPGQAAPTGTSHLSSRGRAHTLTGKSRRPSYLSWRKLGSSPRGLAGCRGCWSVSRSCASSPHISAHVPSVSVALVSLSFSSTIFSQAPNHPRGKANRHGWCSRPHTPPEQRLSPSEAGSGPPSAVGRHAHCGALWAGQQQPRSLPTTARSSPGCDNKGSSLTRGGSLP